jgi:hypothetical protein
MDFNPNELANFALNQFSKAGEWLEGLDVCSECGKNNK